MLSRTLIKFLLFVVIMATLTPPLRSAEVDGRSEAQLLRKSFVSEVSGQERDYYLFLPKGYETETGRLWPVILFLHGGGERGDGKKDLPVLLKHGPLKEAWEKGRDLPFIMIAPQMPPRTEEERTDRETSESQRPPRPSGPVPLTREALGRTSRWDRQGPPMGWWVYEKDVLNMVDRTLAENRADADRVYVTGLSYGGFGTFYFAAAHPYRWAAVAPICGAADPDTLPRIAAAKLPIWIITGGRDRTVLPEWVLASAKALEDAGHPDVRFTVHEDRPHDVWTRVYEGWDIYSWFLDHRLK